MNIVKCKSCGNEWPNKEGQLCPICRQIFYEHICGPHPIDASCKKPNACADCINNNIDKIKRIFKLKNLA